MALLYMDGFDHYTPAADVRPSLLGAGLWIDFSPAGGPTARIDDMPVIGGRALHCRLQVPGVTTAPMAAMRLPRFITPGDRIKVGFHLYVENFATIRGNTGLMGWGQSGGAPSFTLGVTDTGLLRWHNGGLSATPTNSAVSLAAEVLYHVEWETYFHATQGSIEVRINGETVFTLTNLNTSPVNLDHLHFIPVQLGSGGSTNTSGARFKNLFLTDASGTAMNDWLGPCKIATVFPNADKAPQDWDLSTGTNAFDLVNNVPAAPTTEFVSASEVGDEVAFGFANLPTEAEEIHAVQLGIAGRTSNVIPVSVTLNDGPTRTMLPSLSQYVRGFARNPDGDSEWTRAAANSLDLLIRRSF